MIEALEIMIQGGDISPWLVEAILSESVVQTGIINVYVQGATAAVMIHFI